MRASRLLRSIATASILAIVFPAAASAAPGDLDSTFSSDGKQTTDFRIGASRATAVARQPDGKIVAVGGDSAHGNGDFALARYNADGTLDPTFSGDGRQTTDFDEPGYPHEEAANGVAIQGDGKIVAVGRVAGTGFALARYNPDGSLDTTFSGDGLQTTNLGGGAGAVAVAIQGDGRIVAAGGNALARYNPDGSLDTTFSGDGMQTTTLDATGVALQGDGKIVAVGTANADFALARYNPDGSLDTTFSGDGMQKTDFGGLRNDFAKALTIQGDGKIVAVGQAGVIQDKGGDFALARYNPDGSLDTGFSGDGKQKTDFLGAADTANGVALQGDGTIVAGGEARGAGTDGGDFALARYNPDGSLDTGFSGDGKQLTGFRGFGDGANGVALQGDGKIVAVGRAGSVAGGEDFGVARFNPTGPLDTGFSADGRQTTNFGGKGDGATGVAVQANGRIVAVGRAGGGADDGRGLPDFALARYLPNGSLDTSFSGDGMQMTSFGGGGATGVALQANGRIVVVGGTGFAFALARYLPNGSLDKSFSGDGKQTTRFPSGAVATGVAIQGDGKIVVVGGDGNSDFALARYNPNGSLDTSFSGDGKQTTDFGLFEAAYGLALLGNGKIVAAGARTDRYFGNFALARYNANGSIDKSFSGDGKVTTSFGSYEEGRGVAVQPNGKIVEVGFQGFDGGDFALARYNRNGALDRNFSGDGLTTSDAGTVAVGVALQDDGKIVVSGGSGGDFALTRFNTNGSLDTTFSGDGKLTTDFGAIGDVAHGVALQGDGKIVVAGAGLGASQTGDFALARYLGG